MRSVSPTFVDSYEVPTPTLAQFLKPACGFSAGHRRQQVLSQELIAKQSFEKSFEIWGARTDVLFRSDPAATLGYFMLHIDTLAQ
jgi:hypothetical protein